MTVVPPPDRRSSKDQPLLNRVIQVRFGDEDHDKLRELAAAGEIPVGALIRLIVHATLLRDPTPDELADLAQDAAEGRL